MNKHVVATIALLAMMAGAQAADEQAPATSETTAPAADTTTAPAEASTTPAAQAPAGTVARATFTSGIADREPVDGITTLANGDSKIFYFTELRDLNGTTITHRWEHNGEVMAEIPFQVGGDRWRVYSSKNLDPSWSGEWKVSVIDANGGTLSANTFNFTPGQAAEETPASQPEETAPAGNTQ